MDKRFIITIEDRKLNKLHKFEHEKVKFIKEKGLKINDDAVALKNELFSDVGNARVNIKAWSGDKFFNNYDLHYKADR